MYNVMENVITRFSGCRVSSHVFCVFCHRFFEMEFSQEIRLQPAFHNRTAATMVNKYYLLSINNNGVL